MPSLLAGVLLLNACKRVTPRLLHLLLVRKPSVPRLPLEILGTRRRSRAVPGRQEVARTEEQKTHRIHLSRLHTHDRRVVGGVNLLLALITLHLFFLLSKIPGLSS